MIGGDAHETGSHQRIRAGGVNINRAMTIRRRGKLKAELQPAGFANPISLHQAHFFRPIVQIIQRAKQIIGHVGDFKEPLRQLTSFYVSS